MKCLAIGMNPNYVLSEEERKRRFKKRNNSISEEVATEEPNFIVPVVVSVTVNAKEEKTEHQEFKEADKEITKTDNGNPNKTFYFNEVFDKERNSYALETISSPQKHYDFDQEMKHNINSVEEKQNDIVQNFRIQRELDYFKAPYPPMLANTSQTRSSIFTRNDNKTKVSSSNDAFIENENKTSVIKEAEAKICKDEETNMYFNNEMKPIVQDCKFSNFSAALDDGRTDGMICKETQLDHLSEIDTSSDSEDEISMKITLSQEPEIIFTEDEKCQLDKLVSDHDTVYHSVNFGEVLIKEMLMCSMFGVPVSTSAAIQGYRLQVERITRISNNLKCFTNLQKVDQIALLKENADLLVSFRGAIFFDKKKKGVDQVLSSMGIGLKRLYEF